MVGVVVETPKVVSHETVHRSIPEQRGWRFHRIWSRSWWDNQPRELERLADAVRAALEW